MKKTKTVISDNFREWVKYITAGLVISALILLLNNYVVSAAVVNGNSMEPSLYNGDILVYLHCSEIERYDIINFRPDIDNAVYVKRVVAVPGETVWISEDGYLYVNGERIEDEYSFEPMEYTFFGDPEITLAEDEYYVLGDNRNDSIDSRILGPVRKENICGEVIFRILPLNRMGWL